MEASLMPIFPNIENGSTIPDHGLLYGYDVPIDGQAVIIHNVYFEHMMVVITISLLLIAVIQIIRLARELILTRDQERK
jgi:hypothetical protein